MLILLYHLFLENPLSLNTILSSFIIAICCIIFFIIHFIFKSSYYAVLPDSFLALLGTNLLEYLSYHFQTCHSSYGTDKSQQKTISLILNKSICFLVPLTESLFYTALPTTPLNNSRLQGAPFEFRYLKGNISESGCEVVALVATALALALLITLVPGRMC